MRWHVKGISLFLLIGATAAQSQTLSLILARELLSFPASKPQAQAQKPPQLAAPVRPLNKENNQDSAWGSTDISDEPVLLKETIVKASATPAVNEIGLQQVVHLALARHPSIADAIATLDQEGAGIDVAKSGYYPQVRMGLGSGNSSSTASSDSSTLATVSASQMIYDFGKVDAAVSQASAKVMRQKGAVLKQIDSIAQQAADTAVMLHRYQQLEAIAREQVNAVKNVYELARLRGEAGLSSQADPIQAWSRVDAARVNFLQIRSQRRQWHEHLRTLLGPKLPARVADFPEALLGLVNSDTAIDSEALPAVLMAKADLHVATAQLDSAKAQRMPTFSLDTSVNKSLNGVNQATMRSDGISYSVMLNVSSNLFQGGGLQAQVRGAAAAEEAAHKRIETALLNADDQVRSFREQLDSAVERLSVLANRRRTINEVRDLYQEQYKLGTRSVLDLLNAEQEIYQAAQDEENVRHDLWQAWVGRVAATGMSREVYDINGSVVQGMEVTQ